MAKFDRAPRRHLLKPLGGYLGLELRDGEEYHKNATRVNTGANAFKAILLTGKYQKIYLPIYNCDSVLQPLKEL